MSIVLTITGINGEFLVSATSSQGEAEGMFINPFNESIDDEIINNLKRNGYNNESLKSYGKILYDSLFKEDIKTLFEIVKSRVQPNNPINLKIQFNENALNLSKIPWELLYDGSRFLVASGMVNLIRYINLTQTIPQTEISLPFHVLLVTSRPFDEAQLDNIAEQEAIYKGLLPLEDEKKVIIDILKPPTIDALINALNIGTYDAIHFDGHGAFTDKGYLIFENNSFQSYWVDADTIAHTLTNTNVKLIILSACQSSTIEDNIFDSIAPALIRAGIPAIIAMQFSIPSDSAVKFSDHFYSSLANFDGIGNAVVHGRKSLLTDATWFIPTLYLRSNSDILIKEDQTTEKRIKRIKYHDFSTPYDIEYFTGRHKELIELAESVDSTNINKFVIWGSGGIGKTVFASKFVKMQNWRFPHGLHWIELRGGKSLDAILDDISLRINGTTINDELEQKIQNVYDLLQNKNSVIIFDNFESVEEDEKTKEFINGIPRPVKVIITSRTHPEVLNWKAIKLYKLSPRESILLFSKMCENIGIQINKKDTSIGEICELLDGYPLALKIIAPLLNSMPIISLLNLLKEKPLDGIELALDTSFNNMDKNKQDMLLKISVFDSYFDENAINALYPEDNWREIKNELVRRSFIEFNDDKFILHPVIRQYAYNKLDNKKKYHLLSADYLETTGKYFEEVDHLYYAGNWDKVIDIMTYLLSPEFMRSQPELTDISKHMQMAKDSAKRSKNPKLEATLESCLGNYYKQIGQYKKALESFEMTYKYAIENDDLYMQAVSLGQISVAFIFLGEYLKALNKQEESLELSRKLPKDSKNEIFLANSLSGSGDIYLILSEIYKDKKEIYIKKAIDFFEEAKDTLNELDDCNGLNLSKAQTYTSLGLSYLHSNDPNAINNAKKFLKKGLIIKKETGDLYGIPYSLSYFSELYEKLGEYEKAIHCLDEMFRLNKQINILGMTPSVFIRCGRLTYAMGNEKKAIQFYKSACYSSFLEGKNIFEQNLTEIEHEIDKFVKKEEFKIAKQIIEGIIEFWVDIDKEGVAPELIQRLENKKNEISN